MALGSAMKRLLTVNDAYGSETMRIAIMDGINELVRKGTISITDISTEFDGMLVAYESGKRNRVIREALVAEHANLCAFVQRMV